MSDKIPWQELALTAAQCAERWGIAPEHVRATIACKRGVPLRITRKPATWKAGEVIEWRDRNRAGSRRKG
ncbi:hypothetical protein RDV84_22625 [Lysobacter yananisis]|uniref:DNA-binding protein n=1 Tax=Lysobacter yananisis TaxID=1003114 RepID=A0ABY9P990_9GAMM|nr:hypothetical protein [Lysobacter yananisis]WMT02726.1 hypothetical protein RDV84_22625 [Lysobacter yananisis]